MSRPPRILSFQNARQKEPRQSRYRDSVYDGVVCVSAEFKRQKDVEELLERIPENLLYRLVHATDDELWVLFAFAEGLFHLRLRDVGVEGCLPPTEEFGAVHAAIAAVTKRVRPPRVDDRRPLRRDKRTKQWTRSSQQDEKGGA